MIGKLKLLYQNHREVITYVFFGGLTTAVSLGTRYIAYFLGVELNIADIISWICSVTFAFFVNKIFVFRNKATKTSDWLKQGVSFYGARLTTLAAQLAFMNVTVYVLGWNEAIMISVAQVFIFIGNYLISKFFVFKKEPKN